MGSFDYSNQKVFEQYCNLISSYEDIRQNEINNFIRHGCILTGNIIWKFFNITHVNDLEHLMKSVKNIDINTKIYDVNLLTGFIITGNKPKALFLIQKTKINIDFNVLGEPTPLLQAYRYRRFGVYKELILRGANIKNLCETIFNDQLQIIKKYIDFLIETTKIRKDDSYTVELLIFLANFNYNDEIKNLIDRGINFRHIRFFTNLMANRKIDILNYLIKVTDVDFLNTKFFIGAYESILEYYAEHNMTNEIIYLIEKGVNINDSAFFCTICSNGNIKVFNLIVNIIDHNILNPLMYCERSPLMCVKDNLDIMDKLLEYGANVNYVSSYFTSVLINALETTYNTEGLKMDVIDRLLLHNVNVNYVNNEGKSAIFYTKNINIFNKLVLYGADINLIDLDGNDVLYYAITNYNIDLVNAILCFGPVSRSQCNITSSTLSVQPVPPFELMFFRSKDYIDDIWSQIKSSLQKYYLRK